MKFGDYVAQVVAEASLPSGLVIPDPVEPTDEHRRIAAGLAAAGLLEHGLHAQGDVITTLVGIPGQVVRKAWEPWGHPPPEFIRLTDPAGEDSLWKYYPRWRA